MRPKGDYVGLLTVTQVTPLLGSRREASIYDDVVKGVFPPGVLVKLGRRIRFEEQALKDWIARGGTLSNEQTNESADQVKSLAATT